MERSGNNSIGELLEQYAKYLTFIKDGIEIGSQPESLWEEIMEQTPENEREEMAKRLANMYLKESNDPTF